MTSHLNLDPHGTVLAYENGYRDGLNDSRCDLKVANEALKKRVLELEAALLDWERAARRAGPR